MNTELSIIYFITVYFQVCLKMFEYFQQKLYSETFEYGNDIIAMYGLGFLYLKQKRYEEDKDYFLISYERGNIDALNSLGNVYHKYGEAGKYYLKSAKNDNMKLDSLGIIYHNQKKIYRN